MAPPARAAAQAILVTLQNLFKLDKVTGLASVELWVLLTTVMLVVRFLFDFTGPWFGNPRRLFVALTLETLNQSLVIYTMGQMQLSAARVNDYFQVWAVLLVTLQYSVKIGRPYIRSKQVPLLDLMSSFWSANLLRVQTFYLLRIPLWLIWSLNAVRIIVEFVTSSKGETTNQESMRLVSDYMSYEDTLSVLDDHQELPPLLTGYKYLVHGEHHVLNEVQRDPVRSGSGYKVQLNPDSVNNKEKLVTVEKIWNGTSESKLLGVTGDPGNQRKDLCLSFALYKLLRHRFYDLPKHEVTRKQAKRKISLLTSKYILAKSERAFRITGVELRFLRDLLYGKHATMFAGGLWVPLRSLMLSLSLAVATGYIAYPARFIPEKMDPADRNMVTHGVFITRLMVSIIVLKELLEIILYVFSWWAKVLMLCKYVQNRGFWHPVVEAVMSFMLDFKSKAKWNKTIRQQNLLVRVRLLRQGHLPPNTRKMALVARMVLAAIPRTVPVRGVIYGTTSLSDCTKDAILNVLKKAMTEEGLAPDEYFFNAFKDNEKVKWPSDYLKVDTHIILVWHIATCLLEIHFFDKVKALEAVVRRPHPFVMEPNDETCHKKKSMRPTAAEQGELESESAVWSKEYVTAVSLSNYCVYLVMKTLVPDNGLVARKVLDEVISEIDYVTSKVSAESTVLRDVYKCLTETVDKPCKNPDHQQTGGPDVEALTPAEGDQVEEEDEGYGDLDIGCSLTRMGAEVEKNLREAYPCNAAGLWKDLAHFWMGFILHLAANTSPRTHGKHLAGKSELITHLWALLTHAGFRGKKATNGAQGVDQEDIPDDIQASKQ